MGCFSYLCKNSGKAVNSDSFDGDACTIYLLENGKVIEEMHGHYDSYGRVFDGKGDSFEWKKDWGECVTMHFNDDPTSGFAVVLDEEDFGKVPTTVSEDDPDQGWSSDEFSGSIQTPFHKIY
jgi:hypothetical protein